MSVRIPTPLLLLALLASFVSLPAQAGFGDLLKKLEEKAPAMLPSDKAGTTTAPAALDAETLAAGLKDALRVGSERAVAQLAAPGGFMANPEVHIPLPDNLQKVSGLLRRFGLGSQVDALEESLNRAAEQAAPAATTHLVGAIESLTIEDARAIYNGGDDAATRYFKDKTAGPIGEDFRPLVRDAMEEVGVTRIYQQLVAQASRYPMVGNLNLDLESYTTRAALDGLFKVLAEQEALIRKDPVARSTELLKQVFGR